MGPCYSHKLTLTAWVQFPVHFYTKCTIPTTMYLHSLGFIAWVSIPSMGPHHSHVPTFTAFHCTGSIPCMDDLFALRVLSIPLCTYIHCIGFNFLHRSPVLQCTYIHCISLCVFSSLCESSLPPCTYIHFIHCIGSIPCAGNLFALRALSPPPCNSFTTFHCLGFNSLYRSPPLPYTY